VVVVVVVVPRGMRGVVRRPGLDLGAGGPATLGGYGPTSTPLPAGGAACRTKPR